MPDLLVRTFAVRLAPTDAGRIVEGRCVPYGVPAVVQDPGTDPYREVFYPGAFRGATKAPDRVHFKFRHGEGLADFIGRGTMFAETDDGLDGAFRVIGGAFGDQALALVDEGIMGGLSVGFENLGRERVDGDGAIVRARCRLVEVSLVPEPAYAGAIVTGRREAASLPATIRDDALDARLRAVGIDL